MIMQVLKDDVKSEIVRQAREEFRSRGYRAASLRRIAEAAGMTVGNIYRYYSSKDELFREVLAPIIGNIELMKPGLREHEKTQKGSRQEAEEHQEIAVTIYNFIERYRPELKLLLEGSGGSSLENYRERLIEWYGEVLENDLKKGWERRGAPELPVEKETIYLIARSVADSLIICIKNHYTLAKVKRVAAEMQVFYESGIKGLMQSKATEAE
jgi:AcrR family transcriptional regulator